ncbi:39S ribosomal protein L53 [Cricetulus griseus]|nr:39S ribosomal protein L53 [Cricetulus griseus]
MASALARVGLKPVKLVRVQFCPFEKNVESTSANLTAQEMFTALASHIRARNAAAASAAANADKPGPVNGTRR